MRCQLLGCWFTFFRPNPTRYKRQIMSEPTKEQIEEAMVLVPRFATKRPVLSFEQTAQLISYIRAQATDDALELAALKCHKTMMLYRGSDAFDDAQQGRADGAEECRDDIRAMKVPT